MLLTFCISKAGEVQNFKVYSPLKLRSGLSAKYYALLLLIQITVVCNGDG